MTQHFVVMTEMVNSKIYRKEVATCQRKKVIPDLSEMEKEKLLSFGEGMAFMKDRQKKEESEKK